MGESSFNLDGLLARSAPAPAAPFTGFSRYNFIGGHGDPEEIPVKALAEAVARALDRDGASLAIYNMGHGPQGYPPLREFLAGKLNHRRGMSVTIDDILVLSGSGQGLEMVNSLFLDKGDTALVEEHSYASAISRIRNLGANVVGVPLDEDGIRIDALEAILKDLKARSITPKFIYTIPTIQNPTGSILPLDRREALIRLAREYGFLIFEDECYADLAWVSEAAPPALYALAPDVTLHIGSFSKTLAPSLRVGYAVAPWPILGRMIAKKSDGGTGALDQMVAAEYFTRHFDDHISTVNAALSAKLDTTIEALEQEFGTAVEIFRPKGGIFVWLRIADIDVRDLVKPAAAAGVVFNPGPEWSCNGDEAKSLMRLCFALPSHEDIRAGIAELARVSYEVTGIPRQSGNVRR